MRLCVLLTLVAIALIHPVYAQKPLPGRDPRKEIKRTGVITGKVVFEDGKPANGVWVLAGMQARSLVDLEIKYYGRQFIGFVPEELQSSSAVVGADGTLPPGPAALTSADGTFRLSRLTTASYDITARLGDAALAEPVEGVAVEEGKEVQLPPLVLRRGPYISGRLLDAETGMPLPKVEIRYTPGRYPTAGGGATTDGDGWFALCELPGEGSLHIAMSGWADIALMRLSPDEKAALVKRWGSNYRPRAQVIKVGRDVYAAYDWVMFNNNRFQAVRYRGDADYKIDLKPGEEVEVDFRLRRVYTEPPPPMQRVKRVVMHPMRCNCADNGKHGDIYAVYYDGHVVRLTTDGMGQNPQFAADQQTIGWTIVEHHQYRDAAAPGQHGRYAQRLRAFPAHVRCYREGGVLATIHPAKIFTMTWKFHNEGRQVATSSQGGHGPTYLQLFNTASGNQIAGAMDYDAHLPKWAEGIMKKAD